MKTNIISDIASYLTFKLGTSLYAIPVLKVLNIVEMSRVTSIHDNNFIIGTINLRGTKVPVIDARTKFGMTREDYTDKSCVVIVEIFDKSEKLVVGIIIDSLQEVKEIKKNDLETEMNMSQYPISSVFRKDKYISVNIIDQDNMFDEGEITNLNFYIKDR